MSELDKINIATAKYISKALIDKVFQATSLWAALKNSQLGYDPDEDEFRDWVMEVRGEGPPEKGFGGGRTITESITYGPSK